MAIAWLWHEACDQLSIKTVIHVDLIEKLSDLSLSIEQVFRICFNLLQVRIAIVITARSAIFVFNFDWTMGVMQEKQFLGLAQDEVEVQL